MKSLQINSVLLLTGISTALLGISMLLLGPHKHITLTTDFYRVSELLPTSIFNLLAALAFISAAGLSFLSLKKTEFRPVLGYVLIAISVVPIGSLFSDSMWIASMGGFPVIGSGQGIIKYFALLSIGSLLVTRNLSSLFGTWISIAPVLLVLLWIGGMKFTLLEAQGIEDLVKSSPLMSWLYDIWSLQTTSNIIGVYDLIAVLLLVLAIMYPKLIKPAILMSGMVFVVTQSFLISFPSALSIETVLSTTGHFLIKDLWFLANLIFYYYALTEYTRNKSASC